jgi:hypothetical protein
VWAARSGFDRSAVLVVVGDAHAALLLSPVGRVDLDGDLIVSEIGVTRVGLRVIDDHLGVLLDRVGLRGFQTMFAHGDGSSVRALLTLQSVMADRNGVKSVGLTGELRCCAVSWGHPPCETPDVSIRDNRQLVAALLDVAGVSGASIEATGAGPGTLRLQLAAGTDQVIVAGEVNRLLRSKFGLAVDPDRVRVIDETYSAAGRHSANAVADEVDKDEAEAAPKTVSSRAIGAYARDAVGVATILSTDLRIANGVEHPVMADVTLARPSRVSIERVQLVSAGLGTAVTVTLALDGRTFDGEVEGAATQTGLLRSVAAATLRAVERITDGTVRFEVEHVEIARAGTDQTALVVVTMLTGRSTERLSGASVVREDTREAVIRAVLAALNRRMEPLLADQ